MGAQRGTNEAPADPVSAAGPSFWEAARLWARIGALSFGGPAGQIALMHREVVETRRWVAEDRFLHALSYCMLLPGPEAQQLAIYLGWLLHGTRGGLVAGLFFVVPGLCVMLALSALYALYHDTGTLSAVFLGLKAAVLAILVEALVRLGRRTVKGRMARAIAILSFVALFCLAVPFPVVILLAGLAGLLGARRGGPVGEPPVETAVAARGRGRVLALAALWGIVWVAPLAPILLVWGGDNVLVAIHLFFAKLALVTFGGAYAILSYVAQQAVETYHWLRPGEMLDGLALAETTPGPLVLVLTFVAFLAAFRAPLGLDPLTAGLLGGLVAAWVTFVPCFALIFLGAPSVETLRHNRRAAAALAAISAAVAGVILNLAVWFGLHVLFRSVPRVAFGPDYLSLTVPVPDTASFDAAAALLALLAGLLLFVLGRGVLVTLAVCAGAGLGLSWL